jgi:hypothetical protein
MATGSPAPSAQSGPSGFRLSASRSRDSVGTSAWAIRSLTWANSSSRNFSRSLTLCPSSIWSISLSIAFSSLTFSRSNCARSSFGIASFARLTASCSMHRSRTVSKSSLSMHISFVLIPRSRASTFTPVAFEHAPLPRWT